MYIFFKKKNLKAFLKHDPLGDWPPKRPYSSAPVYNEEVGYLGCLTQRSNKPYATNFWKNI
jgi:hypothetical protein